MQYTFGYDKGKVIQALRRHFLTRREIKFMLIIVNVFAIISAILFFMQKIRPEPFLLGSVIWLFMITGVFFILPFSIYRKAATFKDVFTLYLEETALRLENPHGYVRWEWNQIEHYLESEHFFHLYFNSRSFFLIPKEEMPVGVKDELRRLLKANVRS